MEATTLTSEKAREIFIQYGLTELAKLHRYIIDNNVEYISSCNIGPTHAIACSEVTAKMFEYFMIYPKGIRALAAFRAMGDPSGQLCFGGYRIRNESDNSDPEEIPMNTYLCYLAAIIELLSVEARDTLERLSSSMVGSLIRLENGDFEEVF